MSKYLEEGYAFPPVQVPSYLSLTQFINKCNSQLNEDAQLSRKAAEGIALSGIFNVLTQNQQTYVALDTQDRLQIAPDAVDILTSIEKVDLDEYHRQFGDADILNVRVRPARTVDDDDRAYMGWHSQLTAEEAALGVTRWWARPQREDLEGTPFIATINGLVVYAGVIRGIEKSFAGLVAFDVCTDTADPTYGAHTQQIRESLLYKRVDSPRGGNIAYV